MTEMTWTRMTIGGGRPLTERQIEALAEALQSEFYDTDTEGAAGEIERCFVDGKALEFSGNVNFGNPERVCALCQGFGLTYSYRYEAGYEWTAGGKYWSPECSDELDFDADNNGEPMLSLAEVRHLLDQARKQAADSGATVKIALDIFETRLADRSRHAGGGMEPLRRRKPRQPAAQEGADAQA
jgi:hypothetical protein